MEITVLYVEHCPHLKPLMRDLRELLAGRDGVVLTLQTIRADAAAQPIAFHGSPTILLDGQDPFPGGAASQSLACRRFETENGIQGFPSHQQLVEALRERS
ncbi:MAG TPA: hypothetical protein VMV12_00505 [Candidatus Micrarchaeaceae archaeon]|nr:hypothetical protein [Candidatus Micrarchaeaceae archaeon]